MAREPRPEQALLTTSELAHYLRLNQRTVLKLASAGELPGVRLGNQWRFRRVAVDTWLDDRSLGLRGVPAGSAGSGPATFAFADGFKPSHVIPHLAGTSVPRVLEELCVRAHGLGLVRDKTWFLGALIERENVLTSAVGNEVAFPHTLDRHPEQVTRPFLLLGRSPRGLDFDAPDGAPVRVVVLMGLCYQQLHLPWLKRLTAALRQARVRAALLGASGDAAIWRIVRGALPRADS